MKITDIVLFQISATWHDPDYISESRQALQNDIYPELDQLTSALYGGEGREIRAIYVEVQTDEGLSGLFGPIQKSQAFIIDNDLRSLLIGRDPLATELLFDQMIRMNRHGRSGVFMTGVSPIDCALWDLKGKAWNQPIYRLLGGPTRPAVPAYASMLGRWADS